MKKIGFSVILSLWASMVAANSVEEYAKQSLEMWEPNEVRLDGQSLIIIAKERRVTDKIYRAMIASGLCMGIIRRPNGLDGISKIKVLNQFGRQGYIFEGGEEECKEVNDIPANEVEMYIIGRTHMHANQ